MYRNEGVFSKPPVSRSITITTGTLQEQEPEKIRRKPASSGPSGNHQELQRREREKESQQGRVNLSFQDVVQSDRQASKQIIVVVESNKSVEEASHPLSSITCDSQSQKKKRKKRRAGRVIAG